MQRWQHKYSYFLTKFLGLYNPNDYFMFLKKQVHFKPDHGKFWSNIVRGTGSGSSNSCLVSIKGVRKILNGRVLLTAYKKAHWRQIRKEISIEIMQMRLGPIKWHLKIWKCMFLVLTWFWFISVITKASTHFRLIGLRQFTSSVTLIVTYMTIAQ